MEIPEALPDLADRRCVHDERLTMDPESRSCTPCHENARTVHYPESVRVRDPGVTPRVLHRCLLCGRGDRDECHDPSLTNSGLKLDFGSGL